MSNGFEYVSDSVATTPEREAKIEQIVALKSFDLTENTDKLADVVRNGCLGLMSLPDQELDSMLEQLWDSAR